MANFGKLLLTNGGLLEQSNAQAGNPLKFKRIAMGSGSYSGNILTLTKLAKEEVSVDVTKGYIQNGAYTVEGFFSNEGLQTGFAWREIGLIVENANGDEVLYCYANAGDTYDYIPATADERYSKNIRIATVIGNATNVSIVESEGLICVDTITFNTVVDEFRTDIAQLWSSKLVSGSTLLAEDSAELPFVGMNIYGKSEQNKTTGKQLLNNTLDSYTAFGITFTSNDDGSVTIQGTATGEAYYLLDNANAIPLANTDLIASISGNPDVSMTVGYYTGNTEFVNEVVAVFSDSEKTFIYPSEAIATRTFLTVSTGKTVNATVYPMIRRASITDKTYESYTGGLPSPSPSYPQEIVNVGDGEIELTVAGKNLIPFPYQTTASGESGLTWDVCEDGSLTVSGTSTGGANFYFIEHLILPKGRYKLWRIGNLVNGGLMIYNGVNVLAEVSESGRNGEFEITKDDEEITVYLNIHTSGISLSGTIYPMLTSAKNANSEFELYKTIQKISLTTPNGIAGIPVSSGGNYTDENGQQWICDEVDLERGVLIQRIYRHQFDGTDSVGVLDGGEMFIALPVNAKYANYEVLCRSNYYPGKTRLDTSRNGSTEGYIGISVGSGYARISDAVNFSGDYEAMQAWLAEVYAEGNPLTLDYILETPIETALTDEEIAAYEALHSNNPTTTIFNDSGAEMNARYITKAHEPVFKKIFKKMAALEAAVLSGLDEILAAQESLIEEG